MIFFLVGLGFLASVLGGGKEDLTIFKTKWLTLISVSATVFELMFPSSLESSIHQYRNVGCFFYFIVIIVYGFCFCFVNIRELLILK